ncbi:MAG: chromosome segregation SMC family protein [Candidatus Azambacteria bacterium]|nr:chromosome segregation SMC family protein [Candidatus Azambacteria bacterium]
MKLKKIEISGFKSFAHKTALEFPFNISAIVGPNGSGKSNIVDAMRWVLGEQSFKNLRSKSGADLIWAGSEKKPSQGKASVSLCFDNSDGFFPVDFDEVVIGRKVYRDGLSEYYLNDSQVRLKDIVELLARSKLGLRGHSIVNQGSADEVLKSNPQERRGILEEALGLREFQLKKSEAETKLSETHLNIEQTGNLVNEILPHLKSLKRQVEKFEKRESLFKELNGLEDRYFSAKISQIFSERGENEKAKGELAQKTILARKNFEEKEKLFEAQMAQISEIGDKTKHFESELNRFNVDRQNIMREFGKVEGFIESHKRNSPQNKKTLEAVLAIKIKYWAKRLNAATSLSELETIREIVKNLADELQTISNYFEKNETNKILALADLPDFESESTSPYEKDREELKLKLSRLESEIENVKSSISEVRQGENNFRRTYLDFQKDLELARREYISSEEAIGKFNLEEEKIKIREADIKSEMWGSGKNYEKFTVNFATIEPVMLETELPTELENKIVKLRREIADIGNVDGETMREYEETNTRHEFLTTEVGDLKSAVDSLKSLIKDLNSRISGDFKVGLAKINEEFNHYFRLMFNGGSSRLSIDNLENEEAGVSINVNVPQKRIRDLNLLSGGERALVSIALLFAIVSASKPPFLILDEVDAALDESNAVRFAKVLKDLAQKTQFILITHNRATMETAEVLYGITMGDDGVSKMFSLKLTDPISS